MQPRILRKEVPLSHNKFQIGLLTVVMFVVLRLSLGCHFLYEGVWKIKHADTFSATPFLSEAKGPFAPLYYSMLPDLEGRERLSIEKRDGQFRMAAEYDDKGKIIVMEDKSPDGKVVIKKYRMYKLEPYVKAWTAFKDKVVAEYKLTDEQAQKAQELLDVYIVSARTYVTEEEDAIAAHFASRERFVENPDGSIGDNHATHQQERDWTKEREYRVEVHKWLKDLDGMGKDYQKAVWNLMTEEQQAKGQFSQGWNPLSWPRDQQINFAVTYALTAIGLCLMAGFFTRLAALGGAAFMLNVVLTQPAWPGIYPPDPAVVGHALIINKDFVEMVALFLVATSAAGRWGGLDFFVHHLITRPLLSKKFNSEKQEG